MDCWKICFACHFLLSLLPHNCSFLPMNHFHITFALICTSLPPPGGCFALIRDPNQNAINSQLHMQVDRK